MLLGLDIGTTHLKAGLFDLNGRLQALAARPNPCLPAPPGSGFGERYYDPELIWQSVLGLLTELRRQARSAGLPPAQAVGIAGMAETGLLLERRSGTPRTPFLPWFDPAATPQAERLKARPDLAERVCANGLRPSFKCALAKLLWLQERQPALLEGAIWLGAADLVLYRMSGAFTTDPTLASRTCAYHLARQAWDTAWLESLGLPGDIFAPLLPSGAPGGECIALPGLEDLLPPGTPVAVAGHDHVCAAFAASLWAGGLQPGQVFDSMGTAESLTGAFPARPLGMADFDSGLGFGQHAAPGFLYWMGGLSASGGSLEWLRAILGDPPLDYTSLDNLLAGLPDAPGDLLYLPYLAGSGSPHSDPHVRGAFLGLSATHRRAHLVQAVLEGTAFEVELIRRAAQATTSVPVERLLAAGGGVRNRRWLQIKADVHGCPLEVFPQSEATLLGAALLAGLGSAVLRCAEQAARSLQSHDGLGPAIERYSPDPQRHAAYAAIYEERYLPIQAALRSLLR